MGGPSRLLEIYLFCSPVMYSYWCNYLQSEIKFLLSMTFWGMELDWKKASRAASEVDFLCWAIDGLNMELAFGIWFILLLILAVLTLDILDCLIVAYPFMLDADYGLDCLFNYLSSLSNPLTF